MDSELTSSFELLTQRLALMRELADSLQQVQSAVVRSDLRGIEGHTARQQKLCAALRQLAGEAPAPPLGDATREESRTRITWAKLPEAAAPAEVRERWVRLTEDLTAVEMRVSDLNRVYGALLRRAQRTLRIFLRLLASSGNTYTPPKWEPVIAEPVILAQALRVEEGSHV